MKRRSERLLIAIALLVIAAALLYETFRAPDLHTASAPQTVPTQTASTAISRFAVDLNTASAEELAGVRGVSEQLARAIVEDRAENGRFSSVEDILRVKGVGQATYEKLRAYLTV
ncbi:MAG: helix-hairpin-helix domain-containing protein [Clostridia bacterium]|nr:helix-hairpin-helix domain-containing protein [Clostridia bacterium]